MPAPPASGARWPSTHTALNRDDRQLRRASRRPDAPGRRVARGSSDWRAHDPLIYKVAIRRRRPSGSSASRFSRNDWNAVTNEFGALDLIWGTLATSLFALVIAVPVAIAIGLVSDGARSTRPARANRHDGRAPGRDPERRTRPVGDRGHGAVPAGTRRAVDDRPSRLHPALRRLPIGGRLAAGMSDPPIMVVPIVASISRELLSSVPERSQGRRAGARCDPLGDGAAGDAPAGHRRTRRLASCSASPARW